MRVSRFTVVDAWARLRTARLTEQRQKQLEVANRRPRSAMTSSMYAHSLGRQVRKPPAPSQDQSPGRGQAPPHSSPKRSRRPRQSGNAAFARPRRALGAAKGERLPDICDLQETAAWTIERLTAKVTDLVALLARRDGISEDAARNRYGVDQ